MELEEEEGELCEAEVLASSMLKVRRRDSADVSSDDPVG